jgi:3-hydroxyacyl-CoA dehydrogenase
LNPATFEHEMPHNPRFEAVEAVRSNEELGQRLTALLTPGRQEDRATQFVWAVISYDFAYAAACAQEIAHNLKSIDDAIRWGFNYETGPFELWDKLGVAETTERMEASGLVVASWVKEMLAAGCPRFYRVEEGQITGYYDWERRKYVESAAPNLRSP